MQDLYGNRVTTTSAETIDAIDRFTESLIGYGTDFGAVFPASDNDPDCAVVAALAGLLGLFIETPDRLDIAGRYFARARDAAGQGTEREQLLVGALLAMQDGDIAKALKLHRTLAEQYPQDLLSAKIGQTHYFNLGDDDGMLWLADQVMDAHRDTAYAHGMRAFGLEQMSRLSEAEEEARRATDMQRREPWAHHAVAHVMITQGRLDDGIRWMEALSGEWEDCNSFMYTHNWWHLALFHLESEDFSAALSLYDKHVWGRDKTFSQDQINAISLLWRLELAGVDVGDRWADVADHVAARTFVNDQPFLDMQYAFALARGGKMEALATLMEGMKRRAEGAPALIRIAWQEVALPATEAFVAYARGDYGGTLSALGSARAQMQKIGGSHAQRDLFEQVWIHSLIKKKHFDEVLPLLEQRVAFRAPVKLDQSLLRNAQTQAALS
ncbi:tetratricopeptide repeat protein [Sneathiella chinensis]|uniref:Tetratricopeptide repeat protein 38 n=1 Tax=Sneathiella chinensis TaxID=349750 RepID=A0ABQ5U8B4_9PROT|nr:tetratricopeptide repeat protein [Sneathiella chinensis]GLQ07970.1 tetratricopeptide repeat protein 38 family protein [Sneathiella chinensis]